MIRILIFVASVCVGCTLISTTAAASASDWTRAVRTSHTGEQPSTTSGTTLSLTMSLPSEMSYGSSFVMP